MGKSVILFEFETETKPTENTKFSVPLNVHRTIKVDGKIVFERHEPFENYLVEKSILKDFIRFLSTNEIKEPDEK